MIEVEMKIRGLMMDPTANTPIVILKDVVSDRMLPIWVGPYEANAIALEIEKSAPQRPMTHDLLRNLITQIGATVDRIVVTDLIENTFFAVIEMTIDGKRMMLDSRPSDAIALALRVDCPIFVNEEVINSSRNTIAAGDMDEGDDESDDDESDDEAPDADDDLFGDDDESEWPDDFDDDVSSDYKM
ncbi:MAG: bifunctional nuclease family protein [Blastocatellia bacterium]|nr:bifunctional nuclease family protein [Blastocatellia bacterium]MBK6428376.1 bifunctional nuclease family protein [Blastocatellia bacterium]